MDIHSQQHVTLPSIELRLNDKEIGSSFMIETCLYLLFSFINFTYNFSLIINMLLTSDRFIYFVGLLYYLVVKEI